MNRRIEWLTANAQRRYPFVEDTSLMLAGGAMVPDDAVLDFSAVFYAEAEEQAVLTSVEVIGAGPKTLVFTFTIGSTVLSFMVTDAAAFPYITSVYLAGAYAGTCAFGEGVIALASALVPGLYGTTAAPVIEPALVTVQDRRRVNSVLGTKAGSVPVQGDIYIKEGYNCNVTLVKSAGILRIDGVRGAGKGLPCDKPPVTKLKCSDVFLRINGLTADDNGNFVMAAGPGLTLVSDPAAHKLTFKSAKPNNETTCKESG